MSHNEPPHQDLRCLQIQLYSSLVLKKSRGGVGVGGVRRACLYFNGLMVISMSYPMCRDVQIGTVKR